MGHGKQDVWTSMLGNRTATEWDKIGMTVNESKFVTNEPVTKDPICGMTVDEGAALMKFVSTPAGTKPESKAGGCCS